MLGRVTVLLVLEILNKISLERSQITNMLLHKVLWFLLREQV